MVAFGACNLLTGFAQGFPVTGTDSRTAVNDASGGRTRMVGIVAAVAILLFLLFATPALEVLPDAALAAIILVSSVGMLDFRGFRDLWTVSKRESLFALVSLAGVALLGVLPGVFLAIALSLLWLLSVASHPHDAILGRMPDGGEWLDRETHPEAEPMTGLLVYRFDANLVFFNCGYFKRRLLEHVDGSETPLEWVILDASGIDVVDYTALDQIAQLDQELAHRGVALVFANVHRGVLHRYFRGSWVDDPSRERGRRYETLGAAIEAFSASRRVTG